MNVLCCLFGEDGPREVAVGDFALLGCQAFGGVIEGTLRVVEAWSSAFVDDLPPS